ncbi:Protein fluG [Penicillium oxalicum]|uniref:Protein fluG n=1 Tax=Penicillium oxalicum TaxID=69781 RepID=UPI0020B7AB08|nr:Protein fluG [Penicillium oxalicum]KAI2786469.1 Protein fluG [Penicillium oxalicum]
MDPLLPLKNFIRHHPHIDHHAHHIPNRYSASHESNYPVECVLIESWAHRLETSHASLPSQRAINQLGELYGTLCSTWEDVVAARTQYLKEDYNGMLRRSLHGTHMLLLSDPLVDGTYSDGDGLVQSREWHDRFAPSPMKIIVCIETIAESVLSDIMNEDRRSEESVWSLFRTKFLDAIELAMSDSAVVAFKTDVCTRSGLDVAPTSPDDASLTAALHRILDLGSKKHGYKFEEKLVLDWMVLQIMKRNSSRYGGLSVKPLQFSTALTTDEMGRSETRPGRENPILLQPIIREYPGSPVVLLHAAYPYTKEAGYLASRYPVVFVDFSKVFPCISRDGQERILRESLEIASTNRLLWSTGGQIYPETFWLSNRQFRQALEKILIEYVQCGDCNIMQAKNIAKDILFNNANKLYSLGQTAEYSL